MQDQGYKYFQYHRDLSLPVYIRFDPAAHDESMLALLESMRFQELSDDEGKSIRLGRNTRLLTIKVAGVRASRQMNEVFESDRFGRESVIPKSGYKVYRYKSLALMVYSYGAQEWECGVSPLFAHQDFIEQSQVVLNRFLCWALAPHGYLGFWGVPVDEGVVILKQHQSKGEMVFLDPRMRNVLSVDGLTTFPALIKVIKLDPRLQQRNVNMTSEELLTFLSTSSGYLDPEGLSVATRQLLQALSSQCMGINHPEESFKPRGESSL